MSITMDDIAAAAERTAGHLRRTPVMDAALGDQAVSLKLELTQHAGSFKPRGAFNNLLSLDVPAAGIAAASGGNHGAAVAYAASQLGVKARIFVPEISSPAKIARIRDFGAEAVVEGARYADSLALCEAYMAESDAIGIHAYDAELTMAGQGTLAREWEEQAPDLDTVLVSVGGAGLISGMAAWYRDRVKVVAVEPETSRCLNAAIEAGGPVDVNVAGVAADSLGARSVGKLNWPVIRDFVDESVLVADQAITEAQKYLWPNLRLATEPGAGGGGGSDPVGHLQA